MLSAKNISSSIPSRKGAIPLLDQVNLEVDAGHSAAVVGRSGSGKTSLLSILGLMRRPESGTVMLDGQDLSQASDALAARMRNRNIGFVFQSYSLIPNLNVLQNVTMPATYSRPAESMKSVRLRAAQLLEMLGVDSFSYSKPSALSGGEQQRVAIARSLLMQPKLLLADEPTGALDVETGESVINHMVSLTRSLQTSLVVVTHDMEVADRLDRKYSLVAGRLLDLAPEASTASQAGRR